VLVLSQEQARRLEHGFIGTEHILLGLIEEADGIAARALESLGVDLAAARLQVEELVPPGRSAKTDSPAFTPRAKKVLELSLREALQLGHNYIGTEHMLLGLVREGEGVAAQVLIGLGADLSRVRQQVMQLLSGYQGLEVATVVRHGVHKRKDTTELGRMSVGGSWTAQVVRAGRRPEDFAVSYERMANLLMRLGVEVDDSRISVASVETDQGPGLCFTVVHDLADDLNDSSGDEGDEGAEPSGDEPPA
jgi:ATP-dependent Clp protease ATP-binding subunit ClpA